jgi:hypothetical protein
VIKRLRILFSFCRRNRWSRDWWFSLVSAAAISDPENWFYQFLQQQWPILRLVLLVSAAAIGDPENWFYQFLQQQWAILRLVLLVSAAMMGDPGVSSRQKSWWFFCVYVTQASKQRMQQIHLMMFTGQANMKFPFLKQKLQRSWSSSSSNNMMTQNTLKTNLQLQYTFCWEILSPVDPWFPFWEFVVYSQHLSYASYESSIVVVQHARKGWRSKTAWKLHVEKSNCNIPQNCGAGKHKVDAIKSHVRMLMIYSLTDLGFALSSSLRLLRAQSPSLLGLLQVEILELTSWASLCNNNIEIHC